tara:strand:+ start:312 stop:1013 length:702 start_codon:yes stop_codon:yes gene_type:complete
MAGAGLRNHHFENKSTLVSALKKRILENLKSGIQERGSSVLVVSGGSTPRALFEALSQSVLDWHLVTIVLADERWVLADDKNSNESFVRATLLVDRAASAKFVSLLDYYPDFTIAEIEVDKTLGSLPIYDAVILGMGLDGHTASVFPCADTIQLNASLTTEKSALFVDPTTAKFRRLTQSVSRLRNTRFGAIHIEGIEKKFVLDAAKGSPDNPRYPVSYFTGENTSFEIYFSE